MKDLRFWSIVLSVTWFLVGLAAGHLVSAGEPEPGRLAGYADRLSAEFDLKGDRRSYLVQVLDRFESERLEIRNRYDAQMRASMEPELRELNRAKDDVIRNEIIPPKQRERFDAYCAPVPLAVD